MILKTLARIVGAYSLKPFVGKTERRLDAGETDGCQLSSQERSNPLVSSSREMFMSKCSLQVTCLFLLLLLVPTAEAQVVHEQGQMQKLEEGFVSLFDGKTLDGWKSARSSGEGDWGPFSVNEQEQAIHVYAESEADSEQKTDCLNTTKEFSHYILKLEYKWMEKRFAPRADWDRDAGLLFHVHGNLSRVWPFSLEMQIGESPKDKPKGKDAEGRFHTGDLFVLGGHLRTDTPQKDRSYAKDGKLKNGRNVKTILGTEKPKGQWNEIEIRVLGSKQATFVLNGEVVLETFNFTQKDKEEVKSPLSKGHIGFQAEWAELMYRNIRIKELPAE